MSEHFCFFVILIILVRLITGSVSISQRKLGYGQITECSVSHITGHISSNKILEQSLTIIVLIIIDNSIDNASSSFMQSEALDSEMMELDDRQQQMDVKLTKLTQHVRTWFMHCHVLVAVFVF